MAAPKKPEELTLESLNKEVQSLKKTHSEKLSKLEKENSELRQMNVALGNELKKKSAAVPADKAAAKKIVPEKVVKPQGAVTVAKKKYQFTAPKVRNLKGQIINAAAIVENPELFEEELKLWAKNAPGILKEV